ncbi:hypothetical protein CRYUN_Cryun32bG0022700 [Craigia yunnanensis]
MWWAVHLLSWVIFFGRRLHVIGGRADPLNVLRDVWVLNTVKNEWRLLDCTGSTFLPRQHCQQLALLDMRSLVWKHVTLNSMDKELFVRCTANVVHDDLIIAGGGAASYAFGTRNVLIQAPHVGIGSTQSPETQGLNVGNHTGASSWVVQLERKKCKIGKGHLEEVWMKFCAIFPQDKSEGLNDHHPSKPFRAESFLLNEVSSSEVLDILKEYGATKLPDEVVEAKKASKSPLKIMTEAVASLIRHKGLSVKLLEQLPNRWERVGDIVVLPASSFRDPVWDSIGEELWPIIARLLNTWRLARQGRVAPNGTRDSTLEILVGDCGWVDHRENGILCSFDATKCMFSWGNLSEKIRMANLDCTEAVIVDLFAGIGYFVLPFLVSCIILEGDNQITAPKGVAYRVCLGLLPSSEGSWLTAVRALRSEGGILHVHRNVKDTEEELWTNHVSKSICESARSEGYCWEVTIDHVEKVKWYSPHIRHVVADVRCRQIQG